MIHRGACHCGAVRFEVEAPESLVCHECNCSICSLSGHWHLIVPRSKLTLLSGAEVLTTYTFNTHVAQHYFCRICGIRPYYVPRSNPDGYDVNARCLAPRPPIRLEPFDGLHWEEHAHEVAHLSRET